MSTGPWPGRRPGSMCEKVQEQLDVCLDTGAASLEPNAAVHLENCTACSAELESRQAVRKRLRIAVSSIEVPGSLAPKIRASREHGASRSVFPAWKLAGIAAVLAVCVGGAALYQARFRAPAHSSGGSPAIQQALSVSPLMAVGLSDHVHCALARKYPKIADPAHVMEGELGPEYRSLLPILQKHIPSGSQVMMSHKCAYKDRHFVHFILKDRNGHLISVVLTRKGAEESFAKYLIPALSETGVPVYQESTGSFQIASIESRDYLVYVVSDLAPGTNIAVMAAMAPGVREFLVQLEG